MRICRQDEDVIRADDRMNVKAQCSGALGMIALLCLIAGIGFRFVPNETPVSEIARIFDSLSPWVLAFGFFLCMILFGLGARVMAFVLSLAIVLGAAELTWSHRQLSLPRLPDQTHDLRVLFFNLLGKNAAWGRRIVDAAIEEDADILIFAEADAVYPALKRLRETHDFVSPCPYEDCEVLVATKRAPKRFWRLSINEVWDNRYAVSQLETNSGKSVFVVGNHLTKPWLSGITEAEHKRLAAQYDWLSGPVVAVGDFNSAPWSLPMRTLMEHTGFRAVRRPLGTWPVVAGNWGVPIDQVLVHNGARVVDMRAFGADFNSNHRGFVVDIVLP
ncbi:MAG: endonuclease/exonuclease/phosphatase family protein [Paracoccaceae bacterium]